MKIEDPVLLYLYERLLARIEEEGLTLDLDPVQHGMKLRLASSSGEAAGTLYHSTKKRRLSWVPNGKGDEALARRLAELVAEVSRTAQTPGGPAAPPPGQGAGAAERGWTRWIGSDEAGKGDLFGPLVVGAFLADRELQAELAGAGVKDSKLLKPPRIRAIAAELRKRWPDRCAVVEIGPRRYNEMYPDFAAQGGVNGLLGWAHARAIRDLAEEAEGLDGIVVDRFGGEGRLRANLPRREVAAPVVQRPRAEDNLAVAAGAILARARFDRALDRMEEALGFRPHAGSGAPALADLQRLAKERRREVGEYAKAHFAPVKALGLDL